MSVKYKCIKVYLWKRSFLQNLPPGKKHFVVLMSALYFFVEVVLHLFQVSGFPAKIVYTFFNSPMGIAVL